MWSGLFSSFLSSFLPVIFQLLLTLIFGGATTGTT